MKKIMTKKTDKNTREWLHKTAENVAASYLMDHDIENAQKPIGERGYIRPYVRTRDKDGYQVVEIIWLKMRSAATKKNPRRMFSEHIRKGKGHKYPLSAFRDAQEWEIKMIQKAEDVFALIRQQNDALAQLDKRVTWIAKRNQKIERIVQETIHNGAEA